MSRQKFKTVYFRDHPAESTSKKNLKLAFGEQDSDLYAAISPYSSCEIRSILGADSFVDLRQAAQDESLPVNTYCLKRIRRWSRVAEVAIEQLDLPILGELGIHSTFRSGRDAPLQRWYPWLEGYSPDFVRQIIADFAPNATRIFDPFGGCGTTPITAAMLGRESFYCELNPLLQFIVDAKTKALAMNTRDRKQIADRMERLSGGFVEKLRQLSPDSNLQHTYLACFGESEFFEKHVFDQVLRSRTLIDQVACEDRALAQFVTVAILTSLVPSSRLKRAGDLRFRRGKELQSISDFCESVSTQLNAIAEDIRHLGEVSQAPVLVASDARSLERLPSLGADAVITSPPYLNGTNYFRNTKIELWFLRSLRTSSDIGALRAAAVTAGINDVTRDKPQSQHPDVQRLVASLRVSAYDSRIPQMVANYFHDMELVLRGLSHHMKVGSVLALDIGDSIYAGQRVPTDSLLASIAEKVGFHSKSTILLRNRVSRDSTPLRQVLMVFELKQRPISKPTRSREPWRKAWDHFKTELPHQKEPFARRNWGHSLHSLCSYQGKMKPSLAHFMVRAFAPAGGRLLDPFAGVGTIPFEAALSGVDSFGFEISPAALAIASAKIGVPDRQRVEGLLTRLSDYLKSENVREDEIRRALTIKFNGSLPEYFHPQTLAEILLARRYFEQNPANDASEQLVFASLLHVLHGNRPYALSRRSHPITPFAPTGQYEYRSLIESVRAKASKSLASVLPTHFAPGVMFNCDATSCWPQAVNNLDAIITSPPFFASTRFYSANWMRLWFAGWEREDFEDKPRAFVDERQRKSFRVYESIFRQARERLKTSGIFVLHLGQSKKCDMATEIRKVARPWFAVADLFQENVEHCESHGIRDKGTVTAHQFLVLK